MLFEQLSELRKFGLVEKKKFEGYPLHVEYSISGRRGRKMLEAVNIMQMIGIDYMVENGMKDILFEKGIVTQEQLDNAYQKNVPDSNNEKCDSFR